MCERGKWRNNLRIANRNHPAYSNLAQSQALVKNLKKNTRKGKNKTEKLVFEKQIRDSLQ
jgi:hypothetical protein